MSSEFWLLILVTHLVARPSRKFTQNGFVTHSWLITRLASHETPRNSFLKGFSWETYFKPLSSSLKPLFQYFYIKTQSIWIVFHSINISKVIINSFHWFWSLDYVLESFVLLLGIFIPLTSPFDKFKVVLYILKIVVSRRRYINGKSSLEQILIVALSSVIFFSLKITNVDSHFTSSNWGLD